MSDAELELDGQLAVIRNDLAMGRFDDKELEYLKWVLSMFNGFVGIRRKEVERLNKDIDNAIAQANAEFDIDKIADEMKKDLEEDK